VVSIDELLALVDARDVRVERVDGVNAGYFPDLEGSASASGHRNDLIACMTPSTG